jgi:hypothetical protein
MLDKNNKTIAHLCVAFALVLGACVTVTLYAVLSSHDVGFGGVAALILVGLAACLGVMNILSFSAGWLGIADAKQAFGLPQGTVRAILTLAFIVLVGVLASYLVTNSDGRAPYSRQSIVLLRNVNLGDAQNFAKTYNVADGLVSIVPSVPLDDKVVMSSVTNTSAIAAPMPAPSVQSSAPELPAFDVMFYPRVDHRLGEDVSKQTLTMLSTILAAMIGFYFGTKPGESDSGASKRAHAVANIERILASAPKLPGVEARVQSLLNSDALKDDYKELERREIEGFKSKLVLLKDGLSGVEVARLSIGTTSEQMQYAAETAGTIADELQAIVKRVGELEKL